MLVDKVEGPIKITNSMCNVPSCCNHAKVKGMCRSCYDKNLKARNKAKKERTDKIEEETSKLVVTTFPYPEKITIWHTSDDKEHGDETTAMRWQLDIYREKLSGKKS